MSKWRIMHTCDHVLDSKQFVVVTLTFWETFSNISWNAFADNWQPEKMARCFSLLDSAVPNAIVFLLRLLIQKGLKHLPELMTVREESAVTLVTPEQATQQLLSNIFDKCPMWQNAPARLRLAPSCFNCGMLHPWLCCASFTVSLLHGDHGWAGDELSNLRSFWQKGVSHNWAFKH